MIDLYRSLSTGASELLRVLAASLPRLMLAMALFVVGLIIADIARRGVIKAIARSKHANRISIGLAQVVFIGVVILFIIPTLTILGLDAGSLVAGLGLTSLAIGFALRDILENLTAGILLAFSQPFAIGDWIRVGVEEGTVIDITVRATKIKTLDGTEVYLPNRSIYTGILENKTAFLQRRFNVELPVAPGRDPRAVCATCVRAAALVPGVLLNPPTDALCFFDAGGTMRARVFFWANARGEPNRLSTQVLATVYEQLQGIQAQAEASPQSSSVSDGSLV